MDGHTRVPDILLISTKVWEKLIQRCRGGCSSPQSRPTFNENFEGKVFEVLARAKEEGVTIYEVDIAAFAAKVAPLLNNAENQQVRELLQEIAKVE